MQTCCALGVPGPTLYRSLAIPTNCVKHAFGREHHPVRVAKQGQSSVSTDHKSSQKNQIRAKRGIDSTSSS